MKLHFYDTTEYKKKCRLTLEAIFICASFYKVKIPFLQVPMNTLGVKPYLMAALLTQMLSLVSKDIKDLRSNKQSYQKLVRQISYILAASEVFLLTGDITKIGIELATLKIQTDLIKKMEEENISNSVNLIFISQLLIDVLLGVTKTITTLNLTTLFALGAFHIIIFLQSINLLSLEDKVPYITPKGKGTLKLQKLIGGFTPLRYSLLICSLISLTLGNNTVSFLALAMIALVCTFITSYSMYNLQEINSYMRKNWCYFTSVKHNSETKNYLKEYLRSNNILTYTSTLIYFLSGLVFKSLFSVNCFNSVCLTTSIAEEFTTLNSNLKSFNLDYTKHQFIK